MTDPIRILYKGVLRVLLLLLHDFPEFLCDHHFTFCEVIPPSCIQLRNLILSAFPRNMRLPDPFTPNLKVDLLPEINEAPKISLDHLASLKQDHVLEPLEAFLKSRSPASFLTDGMMPKLLLPTADAYTAGTKYNVPLMNALVMHVGIQGVKLMQNKTQQATAQSAPMDIFQHLITELDTEGATIFI
jgi:CCR4-NOT transcription complex subunit 1